MSFSESPRNSAEYGPDSHGRYLDGYPEGEPEEDGGILGTLLGIGLLVGAGYLLWRHYSGLNDVRSGLAFDGTRRIGNAGRRLNQPGTPLPPGYSPGTGPAGGAPTGTPAPRRPPGAPGGVPTTS